MESKLLSTILKERGIKQSWIAEKLKVSTALVSQWVSGDKPISERYQIELRALLLN